MAIDKDTLKKETDALFWAQTGYKPGQKLDPNNPTDKAYGTVWMDIYRKVERAAKAGTLVTTYDHPVVVQHLTDAEVANKAAAAHLDAAVAAKDPATTQANVAAATTATQISAQKAREAAANQPPTVSPTLVKEAGKEAIKTPPPPSAPSGEHIAHGHARSHAHGSPVPQQEPPRGPSREVLHKETNARFWRQTRYKPGHPLDSSNVQDREMAKIWMDIFRQVQHEAAAGTLVFTSPELAQPPRQMPYPQMPYPQMPQMPPQMPYPQMPQMPPQMSPQMPPQMPQMQPYPYPQMPPPQRHGRGHRHHGQRSPMGPMGPMGPQPNGPAPSMEAPSPQGGPGSPPSGAPPSGVPSPVDPSAPSDISPGAVPPPPEESPSIGKYLAIGLAIVAGGGLIYYATSHKASPGRTSKMLLGTPTRSTSMSMLPPRP